MKMKPALILSLLLVSCVLANVPLWPYPESSSFGTQTISVPVSFHFTGANSTLLHNAYKRYINYMFFARPEGDSVAAESSASLSSLVVKVLNYNVPLKYGVDESYTLTIDGTNNVLSASNEWGALRGLETFSQLVEYNQTSETYEIVVLPVKIQDSPRFGWRGLLLDTSRHYQTKHSIYKQLDALEFNKMNVFHWHVTDDQSFPLLTKLFPELAEKGAWASKAKYHENDVRQILEHAHARGIRVIPEFDMPAHANSWAKGKPEIFPNCPGTYMMMDPTNDETFTFLAKFLGEVAQMFPDDYIHLGSDEAQYDCWKQDPKIAIWMKQHQMSDYVQLHNYFVQKVQQIGKNIGKIVVLWQEAFDLNFTLASDTIVQVWIDPATLKQVIDAGHPGLLSGGYYLDQQIPNADREFYLWEDTWIDFYLNDPIGNNTYTPQQLQLVMGGEACMWGEQVDATVIDGRIWPRAAAVAERLWSSQSMNDPDEATPRLGAQRCRMVRRGINASPIYPDYCFTGAN